MLLATLFSLLFITAFVPGEDPQSAPRQRATVASTTANVTIAVVIDNSSSMNNGQGAGNDLENLRFAAAKMFVKLLDTNDRVGLVVFADDAQGSADLTTIRGEADKDAFLGQLQEHQANGFTNMYAAFARAGQMLRQDRSGNEQFILFLTDGQPETSEKRPNTPELEAWWSDTRDLIRAANAPVLAIALTTQGDSRYLREAVAISGGKIYPAHKNTELAAAYLAVFGDLKDRTVLTGTLTGTGTYGFTVPSSVKRAYFVIVSAQQPRPSVAVGGQPIAVSSWSDKRFSVLAHVSAAGQQVPPGAWTITPNVPADSVQAILISRFRVRVTAPGGTVAPLGRPLPLNAYLSEALDDGSAVRLSADAFEAEVQTPAGTTDRPTLSDNGQTGDEQANDLLYSFAYSGTNAPGTYRIVFTATRGGIPVKAETSVTLEAFPVLAITSPQAQRYSLQGGASMPLRVQTQINGQPMQLPGATVVAVVTRPDRTTVSIPLVLDSDGVSFGKEFLPDQNGEYSVTFRLEGVYKGAPATDGRTVTFAVALTPRLVIVSESLNFGTIADLRQGKTAELRVRSLLGEPQPLTISAPDFPNVRFEVTPATIPAGGDVTVTVRLTSDQVLPSGARTGTLVLTSAPDVEIQPGRIPVTFTVADRVITVKGEATQFDFGQLLGSDLRSGRTLHFSVDSTSPAAEKLTVRFLNGANQEIPGVRVTLAPESVSANGHTDLAVVVSAETLPQGHLEGRLVFAAESETTVVTGGTFPISLEVVPWWSNILPWLLAAFVVLLALLVLFLIRRARRPRPTGVLVCTQGPAGAKDRRLTLGAKASMWNPTVSIGRGRGADFTLGDKSVAEQHAVIFAEHSTVTKQVGNRTVKQAAVVCKIRNVNPNGGVKVDNTLLGKSATRELVRGQSTVDIGAYRFKYE